MKHRLSFAYFNMLAEDIVEVVVDDGVELTLEMVEECHQFIESNIKGNFGLLINRVNSYTYAYEAKLSIASYEKLKAIAFVYYSNEGKQVSEELYNVRKLDEWNYRLYSGLELGWQDAFDWLQQELTQEKVS